MSAWAYKASAETNKDGRFRFEGIPTGFTWRFNIADGLWAETRFDRSEEYSIELRVLRDIPAGSRRLRVVGSP